LDHLCLRSDFWLSDMLGYPAWRVEKGETGEPLSRLPTTEPYFAYAKLSVGEIAEVSQLADAGFRVVDTALTFKGKISGFAVDGIRFARAEDRDAVSRIAGTTFRFSRFHLDPLVPRAVADAIKSAWAANFFAGKRGDGMVVTEREGRVVAFLQMLWTTPDNLTIDLIGVDPAWQRQGVGRDMIQFVSRHGTGDGRIPAVMTVGTQAANVASVRLYESLGFRLSTAQYVLHLHGIVKSAE